MWNSRGWIYLILGFFIGCSQRGGFSIPELSDPIQTQPVLTKDVPRYSQGYGIVMDSGPKQRFKVSISAQNSGLVQVGQSATAEVVSFEEEVPCRVEQIIKNVSQETGQSIVLLKALKRIEVPQGAFVLARIVTALRKHVVLVPKSAILIRDGDTWAIHKVIDKSGRADLVPISIKLGLESENQVEVISGLTGSDQIVTQGGLGLLSPSFMQRGGAED